MFDQLFDPNLNLLPYIDKNLSLNLGFLKNIEGFLSEDTNKA